jgi:hypothetical protein
MGLSVHYRSKKKSAGTKCPTQRNHAKASTMMHLRHDKSNVAIMIPLLLKQESREKAHECENQNEKQTMNIGEFIVSYSIAMYTRNPMKNTRKHRQQQRNGRLSHRVAANIPFL